MAKAPGQPNISLADFIKPGSPTPHTTKQVKDSTEAPSRGEEDGEFGYQWADPSTYKLLKEFSFQHRNKPTIAEQKLWELMKPKKLHGYKFRRQHIIGNYITDLVCLDKRLVIEIDGL